MKKISLQVFFVLFILSISAASQTKEPKFSRKRNYIFGALLTFGISAAFLSSTIHAKKRIKSYEKELEKLREAQEKISSRSPEGDG